MKPSVLLIALGFLLFPLPALADCDLGGGNGTRPVGKVVHNADYDVLQVCRSDGVWQAISPMGCPAGDGCVADPCAGSPSPGDVCADGSVYAGLSPDGNVKMFTTPADAGTQTWNNGTMNWIDTAMVNCTGTAESSCNTGEGNTTLLAGLSDAASPYDAAEYCDGLTNVHGNSDWYLPALNELDVMYDNRAAIGGFNTSGSWYWSSSEYDNFGARVQRFSDGHQSLNVKPNYYLVRCVRR